MKLHSFLLLLCIALLGAGCDDEKAEPQLVMPSALMLEVQQDNSNAGDVTLLLSADNANFYTVYFGDEESGEAPLITQSNEVHHQYASSGTYTITVQAHATQSSYISATEEVTVEVTAPGVEYPDGYTSPESYAGMQLVWQDEFNGDQLNTSDWTFETGTGNNGWGNNELQYYRAENTAVQDGYLIITAKEEAFGGKEYTSSRIKTQGKQEFQYGRIDIRANLPEGQGVWPALWMLGADFPTVGWPASGEIDIVELVGGPVDGPSGGDATIHGTVHWSNAGEYASYGGRHSLTEGVFSDEFHVFSIVWDANSITWLVDNEEYHTIDTTPEELSEFRDEFFLIFNVAVGGNWPGSPDASTSFPQRMLVDYVRVFQAQ